MPRSAARRADAMERTPLLRTITTRLTGCITVRNCASKCALFSLLRLRTWQLARSDATRALRRSAHLAARLCPCASLPTRVGG